MKNNYSLQTVSNMVFEIKQKIEFLLQKKSKINEKEIAYLQTRLTRLKEITQTIIQIQEQKRTQKYYFNDGMSHEEIAKVYKLKDGRYIKVCDASDEVVEFGIESCQEKLEFDFSKIW